MYLNHLSICLLLMALTFTCNSTPPVPPKNIEPEKALSRHQLFNNLRESKLLTVVYSDSSRYHSLVDSLAGHPRFNLDIQGKLATNVNLSELSSGAYFLIGTPEENPLVRALSSELPFSFTEAGFEFDDKLYTEQTDVLNVYLYPNPKNPAFPVYVITGNAEDGIYDMLRNKYANDWPRMMWSSWGYELYQGEHLNLLGNFADSTWIMDKKLHFDFGGTNDTLGKTPHFTFISHNYGLESAQIVPIMKACETSYDQISRFIGRENDEIITYNIYPSIEQKGLMLSITDPAHADFRNNSVHTVMNENFQGPQLQLENLLLLRSVLGQPEKLALETGLSIYFTDQWQKKGYAYWASKLFHSDNLPRLSEVLDNQVFSEDSELVMGATAASLVAALIDHWGKDNFLKQYLTWNPSFKEVALIERIWHQHLENSSQIADNRDEAELPFIKGFNFAHEGYRIYNGYGSKLARQSLEKLAKMGSNAVAIVPYSYMRDPQNPSHIPIMQNAGTETDESVIHVHYEAKKLGMYTMLKPQIWLGRSWPGDVAMNTESDWDKFFNNYYCWIRHYALLAEIHEMDALSLGVEFAKATVQRPDDWKLIARKIRKLYSGHLTYSANWGEEFEKFTFWDEFDYIGLNCYYPLSKSKEVSKKELKQTFAEISTKIEKIARRYKKPVVFTEIGFRSVDQTWENPHADPQGRQSNEEAQKMCYEVVFEGIEKADWCKGILWWKWPTDIGIRSTTQAGFTPNTKKAEKTVEKWFERLQ